MHLKGTKLGVGLRQNYLDAFSMQVVTILH